MCNLIGLLHSLACYKSTYVQKLHACSILVNARECPSSLSVNHLVVTLGFAFVLSLSFRLGLGFLFMAPSGDFMAPSGG